MISKLWAKLQDPEYRKAFVASQINVGIPFQIRAMLKSREGWTQQTLAEKTGMLQPRVSGLMTPGKTRPNIETLRRVAEAFDCGLIVKFVPFSELARWSESFDPEEFSVPAFDNDLGLVERKPIASNTASRQLMYATAGTYKPERGAVKATPVARTDSDASNVVSIMQGIAGGTYDARR